MNAPALTRPVGPPGQTSIGLSLIAAWFSALASPNDRDALIHAISFTLTRCRTYLRVLVKTHNPNGARAAVAAIIADQIALLNFEVKQKPRGRGVACRDAVKAGGMVCTRLEPSCGCRRALGGRVHVLDGDTIVVGGIHVWPKGVAAPEA